MEDRKTDPTPRKISDRLAAVIVVEGIALAIALVTPVTPTKTGSTWSPAEFFTAEPSYLQQVLAAFVTVNVILVGLGIAAWSYGKWGSSK